MGRVLSNSIGLAYAEETTVGEQATEGWKALEPNTISTFGAEITTVARNPISRNRQRRKGAVTDIDSSVEFESDITLDAFRDFAQGFVFANAINADVSDIRVAAVTGSSYTVSGLGSVAQGKLRANALIYASGFTDSGNNGLKPITGTTSASAISASGLTARTNQTGTVSFCGYRNSGGGGITWDEDSEQATVTGTGLRAIFMELGVVAGQFLHFGSFTPANAPQNGLSTNTNVYGWARVVSIPSAGNSIVLDKVDDALQATASQSGNLDVLFGEFIRNVPTTEDEYKEFSYTIENTYPGLGDGGSNPDETAYQYALGNYCNTLALSLPLSDKATMTVGFIGTDTGNPVITQADGADEAAEPIRTSPYNTTSDLGRLRVAGADGTGISTDFKSITLNLTNNVSPEKVLASLGAAYVNAGNFEVSVEAQAVFTNPLVIDKIRANETVSMDFIMTNDNGAIVLDFPSMTLGGGGREFPVNESVLINMTGEAFQDATLNTSIGISILPYPIPTQD